jgi:4-hydroxy-tetrahydrodipicolinate synthase
VSIESSPIPEPTRAPVASGLVAAVVTPVTDSGDLDLAAFERVLAMLVDAGVDGVCLGGATAEYPHTSREERTTLIRRAAGLLRTDVSLLVGIGAASPRDVVPLGNAALEAGARGVLVSMPLFFPYGQDDLAAFCRHVAARLAGPTLLYDLPTFTTALETDTIIELLRDEPHLVGIKDSSGRRDRLTALVEARGAEPWTLLAGDDGVIPDALAAGWNGAISGTAGVCPELLVALVAAVRRGDTALGVHLFALLDELIAQLGAFPTPWGIRVGLAARGLDTGPLPLPASPRRTAAITAFHAWAPGWFDRVGEALGRPVAATPAAR